MYDLLVSGAVTAGIAGLISNILVPPVISLASFLDAVDRPGGRKTHGGTVARLGGVAIVSGFLAGSISVFLIKFSESGNPVEFAKIVALGAGGAFVFVTGLVDDIVGVSVIKKFVVQLVSATFVVSMGWKFDLLGLPGGGEIELGLASGPLTVLWIVGVTNAINLIDGLDGLAAGVVSIISMSLLIYALMVGNPFGVIVTAGIVGACLGFLPHNWEPARVFMGDAGSLTLGFLLSTVSIHTALKAPAAVAILVPILALGVPVLDTVLVMLVRFMERPKGHLFRRFLRMFHADRNHLHHLLGSLVMSQRRVVRWIYGMVLVSCLMALIVALRKEGTLGLVLVVVELVALVLVRQLGMARKLRDLSRKQREDLERSSF